MTINQINISDIVVGDCVLHAKRVADSGPGSHGGLVLSSWETAA